MIYTKSPVEHIGHVRRVLTFLSNAGATSTWRKLKCFLKTIDYLGHVICPRHLEITPYTINDICGLQPSTNFNELRPIPGLCDVFRSFIPNFLRIVPQLNRKLCKDQLSTFGILSEDEINLLNTVRDALIFPPLLVLSNSTGHMTKYTEAYAVKVRMCPPSKAAARDHQTNRILVIVLNARGAKLKGDTKNLGIVWLVILLRPYLEETRFTVWTDINYL